MNIKNIKFDRNLEYSITDENKRSDVQVSSGNIFSFYVGQ